MKWGHITRLFLIMTAFLTGCGARDQQKPDGKVLVIAADSDPFSFDPRLIRDTLSINVAHMLYDGLFYLDAEEVARPALAESVRLDESKTLYTFTIRNVLWSNGEPLTAYDFERTIQSVLDPATLSPHANQLFMIKNAKEVKEGKLPLSDVGVKALDARTLEIVLSEPTPYFITLAATHFLYPVHESMINKTGGQLPIVSGPFQVEKFAPQNELILSKNGRFWDAESVRFEKVKVLPLNNQTALQLFRQGEVDWVGSPIGSLPPDSISRLKEENQLNVQSALGTFWLRVNTLDPLLKDKKLRQELYSTIDRRKIVEHITQGGQSPAAAIVPPTLWDKEEKKAEQKGLSLADPKIAAENAVINLIYIHNERNHKIAQFLQQEWKGKLGISLNLEAQEAKTFYERVGSGKFQMSIGSWFADIPDPVNFLDVFKFKDSKTNGTGWENPRYVGLLDQAAKEADAKKRLDLLMQSETILVDEAPVIPLYFAAWNWVAHPRLKNVHVSPVGYFDVRHAYKEDE